MDRFRKKNEKKIKKMQQKALKLIRNLRNKGNAQTDKMFSLRQQIYTPVQNEN